MANDKYMKHYQSVSFRNVNRANANGVGIGFTLPDGKTLRFWLPYKEAVHFREALNWSLMQYGNPKEENHE